MAVIDSAEAVAARVRTIVRKKKETWVGQLQELAGELAERHATGRSARQRAFRLYALSQRVEALRLDTRRGSNAHDALLLLQRVLVRRSDLLAGRWLRFGLRRRDFDARLERIDDWAEALRRAQAPLLPRAVAPRAQLRAA